MGTGERTFRVAVGRFDPLLARGVASALQDLPCLEIVAQVPDLSDSEIPTDPTAWDVAVVDGRGFSSSAALLKAAEKVNGAALVLIVDRASLAETSALVGSTARTSCVPSDASAELLASVVVAAASGLVVRAPVAQPSAAGLTRAEERVFVLLRAGESNAVIAAALGVSMETVRTHAHRIYRKLGVSGRRELSASRRDATSSG